MSGHVEICNGEARKALLPVVKALFMGATLRLPGGRLCYRGANEQLPALPRSADDNVIVAAREGLFQSHVVTSSGVIVDEGWIGVGDFSGLRNRLEVLQAPPDLVTRMNMASALRTALRDQPSGTAGTELELDFEDERWEPAARPAAPRCR
jgi:hypothetical protein